MAAGEILTGGRVSCHDCFVHVAALVCPSFLFRLIVRAFVLAFVERFW